MATEVDADGTWEVDGNIRRLVTPSEAWLDAVPDEPISDPEPTPEERIAELEAVIAALLEAP